MAKPTYNAKCGHIKRPPHVLTINDGNIFLYYCKYFRFIINDLRRV